MAEDEATGEGGIGLPHTWPGVLENMDGFAFPPLTNCSDPRSNADAVMDLFDGRAFQIRRRLNSSLFGAVYEGYSGRCTIPNDPNSFNSPPEQRLNVAIKMSSLRRLQQPISENVFKEIAVMLELASAPGMPHGCAYIMPLVAACLSRRDLFVVTPLCNAGDLLQQVTPNHGVEEPLLQRWFRQILIALAYIHSKNLCHHDLSPENVVVTGNRHASIVMDFGMVQRLDRNEAGEVIPRIDPERFGKNKYMAPEIFRRVEYDGRKADLWSFGVMLLVCLSGEYPWEAPARIPSAQFRPSDITRFSCLVQHGPAEMLRQMGLSYPRLSANALDLLCSLLVVKPENRPSSALELVNHPFFTAHPI